MRILVSILAIAPLVLLPGPASAARAHTLAPAAASFDELMLQAEDQRAAGAYAESAALYGQAFRARPQAQRADQIGEITLRNAMTDYDQAVAAKPEVVLLTAQARLLDEFLAARREAQAAARAKKAKTVPEVPQDLVDELVRVEARIAELREEAERRAAEEAASQEVEPAPASSATSQADEPPASRKVESAILGVGLASFVGGIGLIAGGAWNLGQTRKHVDAQLAALAAEPLYTDEQRQTYRAGLTDWQQQWRGVSTGLIVGGAVLAAAGIGLTSWGVVRMRKHRAGSNGTRASLTPTLGRGYAGAVIDVAF